MSDLRQRHPRQRDEAHLRYVRAQPCCIGYCNRPAEAAHIRMACLAIGKPSTGIGEKPDDKWTVPLCHYHHQSGALAQHKIGEERFWREVHGINPFALAAKLWAESGGEARELMPARPVRANPVKPRKPKEQRRKIVAARRTIPGRRFNGDPIPSRLVSP
ncbi:MULTISPECIES: DUF968 domain-containing protein [unclassified Bradyrhizobium]